MATATTPSRISQLSASIQEQTKVIDNYFESERIPSPSFEEDYPANLPPAVHQARNAILIATDELTDLMLGPSQIAEGFPPKHTAIICLQTIVRYDIASKVALNEEISFAELAKRTNLPVDDLTRIMRQAASQHIFKETQKGYLAHTAASKKFIGITELKDWAHIAFDEVWQATTHMVDAMQKWPGSGEPRHTGFNLAKSIEESFFESMKTNKQREKAFANTMSYMQTRQGMGNTIEQLLTAHDWSSVQKVVDIGGSLGDTCKDIASQYTSIQCVVQDLPEVVEEGRAKFPADLNARVEFMAHDFFQEQPVKDADVYLLRWVLHDWSHQRCLAILRNLIPALNDGANVIVQEFILPEPGVLPPYHEKTIRNMDIAMKAVFNSEERSIEDWTSLFHEADSRFAIVKVDVPQMSNLAVMHLQWKA